MELRSRVTLRGQPFGTVIQRTNGYCFVRTPQGVRPVSQVVAEKEILHRELEPDERVYHLDCTKRGNNKAENLVVIRVNTNKWRPLPSAKIIYVPVVKEKVAA